MLRRRLALSPVLDLSAFASRGAPTAVAVGSGTETWAALRDTGGTTLMRFPGGQPISLALPWLNGSTSAIRVLGKDAFALRGSDGVVRVVDEHGAWQRSMDADEAVATEVTWNPWHVDDTSLRHVADGTVLSLPGPARGATVGQGHVLARLPEPGAVLVATMGKRRVQPVAAFDVVAEGTGVPLGEDAAVDLRNGVMLCLHGARVFRLSVDDLLALC